ncbi:hypothetical protein HORIV_16790 [Vreelandella olivaria]|uniref:Uncharacterized protein n=1 Tax=Vreelandella olivaria TaxID=390919 RepID=A0ABN5WWH7_9GAMM|nr:hypothetical protein HORIV_16790 [Halomonas olivaria]
MATLANKVAIVTGASTGIGFAAAKLFAKEGAAVVVAARRQKELDELADFNQCRRRKGTGASGRRW